MNTDFRSSLDSFVFVCEHSSASWVLNMSLHAKILHPTPALTSVANQSQGGLLQIKKILLEWNFVLFSQTEKEGKQSSWDVKNFWPPKKTAAWKYGGLQPGNIQDKILLVSVFIW